MLALLAADAFQLQGAALALLATLRRAAHLARWWLWQPWKTLRTPLVWVLHAAYLWIPVHLVLRACGGAGLAGACPPATHALTVGAIGGLIIGMMTRTARGHTGRPLRADRYEVACYAMVLAAALVRVFVPLAAPALDPPCRAVSRPCCGPRLSGCMRVRYWPILTRARLDGKPG